MDRAPGGLGRLAAPHLVDEGLGGHQLVRADEEVREHRPLLGPTERDRTFGTRHVERAEDLEAHPRTVRAPSRDWKGSSCWEGWFACRGRFIDPPCDGAPCNPLGTPMPRWTSSRPASDPPSACRDRGRTWPHGYEGGNEAPGGRDRGGVRRPGCSRGRRGGAGGRRIEHPRVRRRPEHVRLVRWAADSVRDPRAGGPAVDVHFHPDTSGCYGHLGSELGRPRRRVRRDRQRGGARNPAARDGARVDRPERRADRPRTLHRDSRSSRMEPVDRSLGRSRASSTAPRSSRGGSATGTWRPRSPTGTRRGWPPGSSS